MVREDEEARARLYQRQQERREAYQASVMRVLTGDRANGERIRAAWEPITLAQIERHGETDGGDE